MPLPHDNYIANFIDSNYFVTFAVNFIDSAGFLASPILVPKPALNDLLFAA